MGRDGGVYLAEGADVREIAHVKEAIPGINWAPNGERMVLGGAPGGAYLVTVSGHVTRVPLGGATVPVWSPNGRWLAFAGQRGFDIAHPDGSGRRLVVSSGFLELAADVAWSPDSRRIAYVTCRTAAEASSCYRNAYPFDLYTIGIDGRGKQRVTKTSGYPVCPTWSKTGRLAYRTTNSNVIVVVEPSGEHKRLGFGGCPVWAPDGNHFAAKGPKGLVVVDAVSGKRTNVAIHFPGSSGTVSADIGSVVWSPDGTQFGVDVVYATITTERDEIYTLNVDGSNLQRVA